MVRALPPRLRALGVAGGSAALWLAASALVGWAGAAPLSAVRGPGPARLDDLVAVAAAGGAWLALTWLALGAGLCALAALRGGAGRAAALAGRLAPAALRRAVGAAVGAAVLGGTALAGAGAAGAAAAPAAPVAAVRVLDASAVDRPAAQPAAGAGSDAPRTDGAATDRPVPAGPAEAIAPAPHAPAALPAGWTPDRPAAAPALQRAAEAVRLVTAVPRADAERAGHGADGADEVVVRAGDTLWDIARRTLGPGATDLEVARAWPRWHAANLDVVGEDPSLIRPGQVLRAPG
ncbi:LysM peptidoglycan-binding domain-containing protein [Vallicoccus soli]|uniref:LysM peptidoglycan-binding domain-containing protein n=1 Tax=Vallicoccus soli TaxID=2339232 RepID=UPI0014020C8E|nr:LysM domain-containing protein [Vallicoccus soli]